MWSEKVGARSEPVRNPVEEGAVRRFAEAIGDLNPLYLDPQAARASGWGRRIAPPTFPITLDYGRIPGLELPPSGLIHGEQSFSYRRPLFVGEEILCWTRLREAHDKQARSGLLTFLTFERIGEEANGARVFSAESVLVITETVARRMEG